MAIRGCRKYRTHLEFRRNTSRPACPWPGHRARSNVCALRGLVGYNDEGIFSAIEPGLACFDRTDKRVFSFADSVANDENPDVPPIHDCYALNVLSENEVWIYYYSAFPLVRLVDKRLDGIWHRVPGLGAHAFAVGEKSVVFAGDYGDRSLITRYFPESGRIEMGHAIGDGQPLEFTRGIGRADRLYLVANATFWLLHAD